MTLNGYVAISNSNPGIVSLVDGLFRRLDGQVPLKQLEDLFRQRLKYIPLDVLAEDNPNLQKFRKLKSFKVYPLKDGVVYQRQLDT